MGLAANVNNCVNNMKLSLVFRLFSVSFSTRKLSSLLSTVRLIAGDQGYGTYFDRVDSFRAYVSVSIDAAGRYQR